MPNKATSCDALWQTDAQKAGRAVTLQELLDAAPEGETCTIERYLKDPNRIPEEWKGKDIIFRDSVFYLPCGKPYLRFLHWDGERWRRDAIELIYGQVRPRDFLAVQASAS